jgi:hypothetical protein
MSGTIPRFLRYSDKPATTRPLLVAGKRAAPRHVAQLWGRLLPFVEGTSLPIGT